MFLISYKGLHSWSHPKLSSCGKHSLMHTHDTTASAVQFSAAKEPPERQLTTSCLAHGCWNRLYTWGNTSHTEIIFYPFKLLFMNLFIFSRRKEEEISRKTAWAADEVPPVSPADGLGSLWRRRRSSERISAREMYIWRSRFLLYPSKRTCSSPPLLMGTSVWKHGSLTTSCSYFFVTRFPTQQTNDYLKCERHAVSH